MTTNGVYVPPPADPLTKGMRLALERIRHYEAEHGKQPTPRQYAELYDMLPQSADAMMSRLAGMGFLAPRRPHHYDESGDWSPAEAEILFMRAMLREIDEIVSCIAVNDRPRRDEWRVRAGAYLGERT